MKVINFIGVVLLGLGCNTFQIPNDTAEYKYFVGYGTHKRTIDEGHRVATEDILKQVSDYIGIEIQGSYQSLTTENGRIFLDRLNTKTDKLFLKSHIIDQHIDEDKENNLFSVILVAQYPRTELESETKRVEDERRKRLQLSNEFTSRFKQMVQSHDYTGINKSLPNLPKNIVSENDWLSVNNSLTILSQTNWIQESSENNSPVFILHDKLKSCFIEFGKSQFSELTANANNQIMLSNLVSGKITPFHLTESIEGLPEETKKILLSFSHDIERKPINFSIEMSSDAADETGVRFVEEEVKSSLNKLGFINQPRYAEYRILFDLTTQQRSDNVGGVISVGAKLITTVSHIKSGKKTNFISAEIVGFGGNSQDALKNIRDKIQKYLTSDWIEEFNYRVYKTF